MKQKDFFWKCTSGPQEGAHQVLVASNGDIWTVSGGNENIDDKNNLYLSTDNGDTWAIKNNGLPEPTGLIYSIAVNPINGYVFISIEEEGLFRSIDKGESWEDITENIDGPDPVYISNIFITASGRIYIEVMYSDSDIDNLHLGFLYSNDNGDTWIEKSNRLPDEIIVSLALGKDGTFYAGTNGEGVYRSTDGGDTWLPPLNYTEAFINDLTIADDGSIFAAASDDGVLKSTDKGWTWTQVNNGLGAKYTDKITNNLHEDNGDKKYEIGVKHTNNIIYNSITKDVFVTNGLNYSINGVHNSEVYISNNLGTNWRRLPNTGLPNDRFIRITSLAFNPITGQIYITTTNDNDVYDAVYQTKNYP